MDKVILFGAGNYGTVTYEFLRSIGMEECVHCFCDNDVSKHNTIIHGKKVISFDDAKKTGYYFAISSTGDSFSQISECLKKNHINYYDSVVSFLQKKYNMDSVELNRKLCAFDHIENMDLFFERGESEEIINIFWGKDTPFYNMFKQLDLNNVIELACGRGRHLPYYIEKANQVTLVDILEKNIDYCKDRFKDTKKIKYYVNNGHDLSRLDDNSYTSIFSYDSMVHFEMFDVYDYLKETYRVLKDGGKALFHHSNLMLKKTQSYMNSDNPGGRNFMCKELFAYLADKAGLEVLEQEVIDWSLPKMDCITLLQKS